MDTYNKTFNEAWEHLKELHPTFDTGSETLDLSVKPKIKKADYCKYIDSLYQIIVVGLREKFITPHVDRHGHPVYIKFIG